MHQFLKDRLDEKKALDVVSIQLKGRSPVADYLIIASGVSSRQIISLGGILKEDLKHQGVRASLEGVSQGDWILVDAGSVIVHLFRPEVRAFYNLEKMWGMDIPYSPSASFASSGPLSLPGSLNSPESFGPSVSPSLPEEPLRLG